MSQYEARLWEYEVVSISDQLPDAAVKAALNDLGTKGWELTGMHAGAAGCPRYVFKRQVGGMTPAASFMAVPGMGEPDDEQERWLRNVAISEALLALPEDKSEKLVAEVLSEEERQSPAPPSDFYERVVLYFSQQKDEA